jgi:hypothetical protein
MEDTGPQGACLGKSLMSVTPLDPVSVKISYGGGDTADSIPRQVDIYINCEPEASVLTFENFIPAIPQDPPPPVYLYQLYLSSSSLCNSGPGNCSAMGFSFSQIAAIQNSQISWQPSPGAPNQTLTYAPCSAGTSTGCGTQGPPANQCTGQSNCCAVCQSWTEDTGPQGACLGLSNNLMGVTIINPVSVKISYGGGDMAEQIQRRVDVYIGCDPTASTMTFVKFIQPMPIDPPPPYYLYQLFLTSSTLCNTQIPDFLSSLGISLN